MKRIVFYDDATFAPYSDASLEVGANGIGGAEASVARLAVKLSEAHHVTVAQRFREESEGSGRLQWIALKDGRRELARADAIVIVRKPRHMLTVRRFNSDAPVFLWYHDWNVPVQSLTSPKLRIQGQLRTDAHVALHNLSRVTAVGVSRVHAANIRAHLAEARTVRGLASKVRVDYVYNPIPDELAPSDVIYDPTKLVFVSAPWKGFDMVLRAFEAVRRVMPDMRLHVATPGYAFDPSAYGGPCPEGVTFLGSLSHGDVIEELRSALCVFYPANVFPETFGCVFAESHAVGTPVLAHPFGAARELLGDDEFVDADDLTGVVDRVRDWRDGARPVVSGNDEVRVSNVAESWERLFFAGATEVSQDLALACPSLYSAQA
jgi:glycosyltransferase involved in cell wall biosynthesis